YVAITSSKHGWTTMDRDEKEAAMRSRLAAVVTGMWLLTFGAAPAAAQGLMNGAGATFPYPIYSKWFDEDAKVEPSIRFNYQSIGSGGGIRQITDRTVDF